MPDSSPPTPQQKVHALLVELFQEKDHVARTTWLLHAGLSILLPYLAPNQSTITFVTDLLGAAYEHGKGSDHYLRLLLMEVREDLAGHSDLVALLTTLLQQESLANALFPAGQIVWAEETRLHRTRAHFQRMPTNSVPDPAPIPAPNNMTIRRNVDFVGRQTELQQIARGLKEHAGAAVAAGIGGVGKTQTAIEWVHRYGQYFQGGVFWLDFSSPEAALVSIASAGAAYGWDGYEGLDGETKVARVLREWQGSTPILLIFDNCESIELAQQYTPVNSGVRVLLTSRNTTWREQARQLGIWQVDIVTLPREESIALLQCLRTDLSVEDAGAITDLLGDLPLALHIAGSYLSLYRTTHFGDPATYVKALRSNLLEELEESSTYIEGVNSPTDHDRSIRATFRLSWERLRTHGDAIASVAETLLLFVAQLAPGAAVPEEWLWKGLPEGRDARVGVKAVMALRDSGLMESPQVEMVQLHRLVVEIVNTRAKTQKLIEVGLQVEQVLIQYSPNFKNTNFMEQINRWLPHARYRSRNLAQRCDNQAASLFGRLGHCLARLALFGEAIRCIEQALSIQRIVLGTRHIRTATSINTLAEMYSQQGEYARALPLFLEALDIRQEVLGGHHPHTATSLNTLAELYSQQGKYAQALPFFQMALNIRREVLGVRHPRTAISLNTLAEMYSRQGEYAKALPLFLEALDIRREILGARHPLTAISLNTLAEMYSQQGEYAKALPLFLEALDIRREALGVRHPHTATSLNTLAELYSQQGEYDHALPLFLEALEINREILGIGHPDTAPILHNLAGLYYDQEEYAKSLSLYKEALNTYTIIFGINHPSTKIAKDNLALCEAAMKGSQKGGTD